MTENRFEARVKATGLRLKAADLPKLEILVTDLDRAAMTVRGPRPYAEEPLSAFRFRLGEDWSTAAVTPMGR